MPANKSRKVEFSDLKSIWFESFKISIEKLPIKTNKQSLKKYIRVKYNLMVINLSGDHIILECRNNFYVSTYDKEQNADEYQEIKDTIKKINFDNIKSIVEYSGTHLGSDFKYYSVKFKDPECNPEELEIPVSSKDEELKQVKLNEYNKWDDLNEDIPKPDEWSYRSLYVRDFKSLEFKCFSEDIINLPIKFNEHTKEHYVHVRYWITKREFKSEQENIECNNYFIVSSNHSSHNVNAYNKIEKIIKNISLDNVDRIIEYIWTVMNIAYKYFEVVFKKEISNVLQIDHMSDSDQYEPPQIILLKDRLENLSKDTEKEEQKDLDNDLEKYKEYLKSYVKPENNSSYEDNSVETNKNSESAKISSDQDDSQIDEKFEEHKHNFYIPEEPKDLQNNLVKKDNSIEVHTNNELKIFSNEEIYQIVEKEGKFEVNLNKFKELKFKNFSSDISSLKFKFNRTKKSSNRKVYIKPQFVLQGTTFSQAKVTYEFFYDFQANCSKDVEDIKKWIKAISLDNIKRIYKGKSRFVHTFYSIEFHNPYKPPIRENQQPPYFDKEEDNLPSQSYKSTANQHRDIPKPIPIKSNIIDLNYNKPLFDEPEVEPSQRAHDEPPKQEVTKTKIDLTGVKALRFAGFKENIRYLPVLFKKTDQTFYIRVRYNILALKKRKRYQEVFYCCTNFTVASKYPLESFYACIERKIANLSLDKIDYLIECTEINNEKAFKYCEPQFKNENYFPVWDRQGHALH